MVLYEDLNRNRSRKEDPRPRKRLQWPSCQCGVGHLSEAPRMQVGPTDAYELFSMIESVTAIGVSLCMDMPS